ncbi:hypothetical protein BC830DRAFT_30755 [Chytriomyces sp. MP71]|nr:hypothetical protein BC830DRAFT_30755 [Chytriomyces sp. MP71]
MNGFLALREGGCLCSVVDSESFETCSFLLNAHKEMSDPNGDIQTLQIRGILHSTQHDGVFNTLLNTGKECVARDGDITPLPTPPTLLVDRKPARADPTASSKGKRADTTSASNSSDINGRATPPLSETSKLSNTNFEIAEPCASTETCILKNALSPCSSPEPYIRCNVITHFNFANETCSTFCMAHRPPKPYTGSCPYNPPVPFAGRLAEIWFAACMFLSTYLACNGVIEWIHGNGNGLVFRDRWGWWGDGVPFVEGGEVDGEGGFWGGLGDLGVAVVVVTYLTVCAGVFLVEWWRENVSVAFEWASGVGRVVMKEKQP